jgi:hypothetical protein
VPDRSRCAEFRARGPIPILRYPAGSQELLDIPRQFAANCASQHIESRQRKASMGSNYKTAQGSGSEEPATVMPPGLTICLPATNESGILGKASIVGKRAPCGNLAALAHEHALVRLEE